MEAEQIPVLLISIKPFLHPFLNFLDFYYDNKTIIWAINTLQHILQVD